ncbi:MAG: type II secretion system protein [Sedimentisphaerales bacterium]|jgi:prepilin-type N-terminal cleavage/methylation domain-containing protein/prepilin-type processing-associated H-X9-DG protein|nr:type II secretion system protein [Sedimentisphaerales bacterium]NLT77829.1 type II secretion system protein [Planctomycetota bacterium]
MRTVSKRWKTGRFLRGGFTLVELLVVVAIICLLMSLSLPALNQAHRQAEQVHCLANQRQLMLAWLLYAPDHDDRLCTPNTWTSNLKAYLQSEEVLLCKTDDDGKQTNSYGLSNTMGGVERDGVAPFVRLHQVSSASAKMVFIDKERRGSDCFWPLVLDDDRWLWRPWSLLLGLQGLTNRHRNGCNLSFADGHGDWVHWKDDRTRKLIQGRIADSEEGSMNNPDLEYMIEVLTVHRTPDPNTLEGRSASKGESGD